MTKIVFSLTLIDMMFEGGSTLEHGKLNWFSNGRQKTKRKHSCTGYENNNIRFKN